MGITRHFVGEFAFFCYLHWVIGYDFVQWQRDHDSFPSCCFFCSLLVSSCFANRSVLSHAPSSCQQQQRALLSFSTMETAEKTSLKWMRTAEWKTLRLIKRCFVPTLLPFGPFQLRYDLFVDCFFSLQIWSWMDCLDLFLLIIIITYYLGLLFACLFAFYFFPIEDRFCPSHITSPSLEVPVCPQAFLYYVVFLVLAAVVATKAEKSLGVWKLCCSPVSVSALREFYLRT